MKEADKYYRPGKSELDWENPEDRIAMVKDCGFTCDWDIKQIDKAKDIDELIEIVEEHAAFDDGITNKEYCEIVEYANMKIKAWRYGK